MRHEPNRKDGRYMDFEEVTVGSVILVDKEHEHNKNFWSPGVMFMPGDIWIIESLANRPREAVIRNLQRNEHADIRVDVLLELDDKDIVTIGPG